MPRRFLPCSTKRSAAELFVGTSERSPAIQDLVDRVVAPAHLSATDVSDVMDTEQGTELARLEGSDPVSYLRPWDSIGRASPAPLTDAQYARFLRGEHPVATVEPKIEPIELYGANAESER